MLDEEEALSLLKAVFNRSNDSKKLTYTGMKKVLCDYPWDFLNKIELFIAISYKATSINDIPY